MDRVGRKRVVCFGSSSGEMLDYLFGDSPNYFSLWCSGNPARAMPETFGLIDAAIGSSGDGAIALCVGGTSDVLFHMQHVASTYGVLDAEEVMTSAVNGLVQFEAFLKTKGFSQVIWLFFSPVVPLPATHWIDGFDIAEPLPNLLLANILRETARRACLRLDYGIDLFDALTISPERPFLKEAFRRDGPDHHPDYTKIQDLVWGSIRKIPGLPRRRRPELTQLYQHVPRSMDNVFSPRNPVIQRLNGVKV